MDNVNTGMQPKVRPATVLAGPANFAHAMLAVSIHLGMGRNPVCVTCGETWPSCSTERFDAAVDWTARMLGVHPTDAALILSMVGLDPDTTEVEVRITPLSKEDT